jgi:hypothetical protein
MQCLPVHIDVGTNNETLWTDPMYTGLKHARVRGERFFSLVAEFIEACKASYSDRVLIQVCTYCIFLIFMTTETTLVALQWTWVDSCLPLWQCVYTHPSIHLNIFVCECISPHHV